MSLHTAETIGWLALSVLCVALALTGAYLLWRLGRLVRRVDVLVHDVTDETVPLIAKAGVSVDTVNDQLQKVDIMMDSAVDAVEAVDTAVRAVSIAVTEPVKKASSVLAGVGEAASSFRERLRDDDRGSAPRSRAASTSSGPSERASGASTSGGPSERASGGSTSSGPSSRASDGSAEPGDETIDAEER